MKPSSKCFNLRILYAVSCLDLQSVKYVNIHPYTIIDLFIRLKSCYSNVAPHMSCLRSHGVQPFCAGEIFEPQNLRPGPTKMLAWFAVWWYELSCIYRFYDTTPCSCKRADVWLALAHSCQSQFCFTGHSQKRFNSGPKQIRTRQFLMKSYLEIE